MPRYRVEALEKFVVRTVYFVSARSPQQAERECQSGQVAYDEQTIEEGNEEWLETISVLEQGPTVRLPQNRKGNRRARSIH
jgi:hypothetical protein